MTRRAFLALDHAALKGEVALVAVGNDFFDTTSGASRHMTENGHKRHEHPTFLSPAVATGKTDASRARSRLELRVSPMKAIERKFSLARCKFALEVVLVESRRVSS